MAARTNSSRTPRGPRSRSRLSLSMCFKCANRISIFQVVFTDEPSVTRIVWLFSFVRGYCRLISARFVLQQDMQTVVLCHTAAFEANRRRSQGNPLRPHEDGGKRPRSTSPKFASTQRTHASLNRPLQQNPGKSGHPLAFPHPEVI